MNEICAVKLLDPNFTLKRGQSLSHFVLKLHRYKTGSKHEKWVRSTHTFFSSKLFYVLISTLVHVEHILGRYIHFT
ncbi:hypothetical protein NIT7645_03728 [Phaeobacter italicus]|nr:hypothetical protein NIT7645_03728 [Phaeobacter italicus]SFH26446.1 hypothetical protein SAMN04488019_109125 [Phaeobacter italicus]